MSRRRYPLATRCRFRQPQQPLDMIGLFARDWGVPGLSVETSFAAIGDRITKNRYDHHGWCK